MKRTRIAAFALASALLALPASAERIEREWWNVDFESPTPVTAEAGYGGLSFVYGSLVNLTNDHINTGADQPYASGRWSADPSDESFVTNGITTNLVDGVLTEMPTNNYVQLDTQGNDLTWTPTNVEANATALVDAMLYLVGSDSPPDVGDFDKDGDVQTAIYLKNEIDPDSGETTNSVLCIYAYDKDTRLGAWKELDGAPIADNSWHRIQVEVVYATGADATIHVVVDGQPMFIRGGSASVDDDKTFAVAHSGKNYSTVNSVSFRGTGKIDNFVAKTVETVKTSLRFEAEVWVDTDRMPFDELSEYGNLSRYETVEVGEGLYPPVTFSDFLLDNAYYDDELEDWVISYSIDRVELLNASDGTVAETYTIGYDWAGGEVTNITVSPAISVEDYRIAIEGNTLAVVGSTVGATQPTNVIARIFFRSIGTYNANAVTVIGETSTTDSTVVKPSDFAEAGATKALSWTFNDTEGGYVLRTLATTAAVSYENGVVTVSTNLTEALEADTTFVTATYVEGSYAGKTPQLIDNKDGTYTIGSFVAKIGSTPYESLREAVTNAVDGDTITLVADDRVSFTADDPEVTIRDISLTIDGNGHTLYGVTYLPFDNNGPDHDLYITGSGDVTITNLVLAGFGDTAYVNQHCYPIWVGMAHSGTLTLDGVTISNFVRTAVNIGGGTVNIRNCEFIGDTNRVDGRNHAFQGGVEVNNRADLEFFATVTITNTTMTCMGSNGYGPDSDSGMAAAIQMSGKGTITVDDGSFDGQYSIIVSAAATGAIVVNGGEFEGGVCVEDGDGTLAIHGGLFVGDIEVASDLDCFIDGGWFDSAPAAAYVADGLAAVDYGEEAPDARATWTVEVPTVRIDFYVDDELYAWTNVAAGTTGYAPADPEKDDTAEFYYVFTGWTNAVGEAYNASQLPAATTPTNYYATFAANVRSYEVEWIVDGTYKTNTWNYNAMPSWNENDATNVPTKASTDATNFVFKAWDPEVVAVTGAGASYTATWTESVREYTITFTTNNVVYETVQAAWHATNYAPANPTAPEGKVFVGWAGAVPDEPYGADELPWVTGDATWNAVFEDAPSGHIGAKSDEGFVILAPADPDYDDTKPLTFAAPDVTAGTVGISASMIPPDSGTTATLTLLYKTDLSAATFSEAQVEVSNIDATAGTATVTLPANLGDTAFFFGFKNEDGVLDE